MDHADAGAMEVRQGIAFFVGLALAALASTAVIVAIILLFAVGIKAAAIATIIALLLAAGSGLLFYKSRDTAA